MRPIAVVMLLVLPSCSKPEERAQVLGLAREPAAPTASSTPASVPPAAVNAAPPRVRPLGVELATLLSEYKDNEVRADSRFKGKRIQTHGIVGEIKKDITGGIYVTFGRGADLEIPVLQCFIGNSLGQEQAAAALSSGKPATVRGTVDGLMMNVLARDCYINPVMELCQRLKVALNASRCKVDATTGDANGIIIQDGDKEHLALGAAMGCQVSTNDKSADERYAASAKKFSAEGKVTMIGSPTSLCYGLFFATTADGKDAPFPDDMKQKAQAVFDGT